MEITDEQRRRAEANRLAALEKRKRFAEAATAGGEWKLSKCQRTSAPALVGDDAPPLPQQPKTPVAQLHRFRVVLEICSPDEFSVTPGPLPGFPFPGEAACFSRMNACLSSAAVFCYIEVMGRRKASIYKLKDYEMVSGCLRRLQGLQLEDIPYTSRAAIEKSSCYSSGDRWTAGRAPHLSDSEVDDLLRKLPKLLRDALLPFQLEGVRFGLRRGGCCLIADEMGLGKTIQAIAIACCFLNEGPILVICPAVLRFSWAEELEHWLPFVLPTDIHLVFGHRDNVDRLQKNPKVVVISYTMLHRLRRSMLKRQWALVIVDESHNIRCTKKALESEETKAVLDVASNTERVILLSGTPSLSRPYDIFHQINILWPKLLGKDKYEFANNYCLVRLIKNTQGKVYQDFSKGTRLEELNVLLRQTVMIRRLKEHVLKQLPPKRRQVIRLMLKGPDILSAIVACRVSESSCVDSESCLEPEKNCDTTHRDNDDDDDDGGGGNGGSGDGEESEENLNECNDGDTSIRYPKMLSYQEIGFSKLSGFREWFSNHFMVNSTEIASSVDIGLTSQKMIIFAHHIKVLDGIQDFICEKGIQFVRIDGSTLPRDRQIAVESFHSAKEVQIAIIGITAGGVGLNFSSAQNVVFLELPKSASEMLQAEDRAHRRGQTNAVNIYIFCAKDTSDESHWLHLNKSLYRISSMMNGKYDAIKEIEVDRVYHLYYQGDPGCCVNPERTNDVLESETSGKWGIQGHNNGKSEDFQGRCSQQTKTNVGCSVQTDTREFEVETINGEDIDGRRCVPVGFESNASDSIGNSGSFCIFELDKEKGENGSSRSEAYEGTVGIATEQTEAGAECCLRADSLRFEVSQYTGRIHLYVCVLGKDLRPRPLFENFRPEEVDSMSLALDTEKEVAQQLVKNNPAYWGVFKAFIKEWSDLRPVKQKRLLGKPLQLPLDLELCYLKETINHGCEGLLKGGSKRRVTPLTEISCPLPENAVWKKITLYRGSAKEKEYFQAWTLDNIPLCKLCQKPCSGSLAKKPEFFEDLFCTLGCFQEFRIRTSQRFLRVALFQIEHGVCTMCKLDCHRLVQCIRPLGIERRREYVLNMAPKLANQRKLLDKLISEPTEGNAWHADHIVPVHKGGGECRLENMRTLCVVCHSEVTAAQRAEQRITRRRAKEQLNIVMKALQDNDATKSDVEQAECGNGTKEEELFVNVPGSAYFLQDASDQPQQPTC